MRLFRRKHARRGSAVVETAVVAPLVVAAMMGTMDVGYAFMVKQTVTLAAREGARTATMPGGTMDDVHAAVDASMEAANLERAEVISDPNDPDYGQLACGYTTTSNIDVLGPADPEVWVDVEIPLRCVSITGIFSASDVMIDGRTLMRREGVDSES